MKVVSLALLYLGSVSFFGVEADEPSTASDFKRRWSNWAQRRARREESALSAAQAAAGVKLFSGPPPGGVDTHNGGALSEAQAAAGMKRLTRSLDVKAEEMAQSSRLDDARIRVKRYRQGFSGISRLHLTRTLCKLGTCTVHNLGHQLQQINEMEGKDVSAPPDKLSPQGYGRRRRRSLPATHGPASGQSSSGRRLARTFLGLRASPRKMKH